MAKLPAPASDTDTGVAPHNGWAEQLELLKTRFPELYACIDRDRLISVDPMPLVEEVDFAPTLQGGRGDYYRLAQRNPLIRAIGIRQLFSLVSPGHDLNNLTPAHKILDMLGGDGVLTRALAQLLPGSAMPMILTADLSEGMVSAAQAYELPAIRQSAQCLLLKDSCLDGVIIAYGTHHIPRSQRLQVMREVHRVLQPGGALGLHDFEDGSPVARWFHDIVHPYSITGHQYDHFTADEITTYFQEAGFTQCEARYMYDPFILYGDSPQQVKEMLADCLLNMYGLHKLLADQDYDQALQTVYELACDCFTYSYSQMSLEDSFGAPGVQITERPDGWCIEMPRVALVGRAIKS
jgi:SAM-dependent methyltransferase